MNNPMRNKHAAHTTSQQSGFTLLEVMIAITLVAVMGGIFVANLGGTADKGKIKITASSLNEIVSNLDQYKMDNGSYPSTDEGLEALVGEYVKKLPKDAWKNEYVYISPGAEGAYDLYSYGADGREGGEALDADIFAE